MKKTYAIKYLGLGSVIDYVEARCPSEAIKKIVNPTYFIATEVKGYPKVINTKIRKTKGGK